MQHTGWEVETVFCTAATNPDYFLFFFPQLVKFKKNLQIFSVAELQPLVQVTSALLGKGNRQPGLLRVQHGENTESPRKTLPLAHDSEKSASEGKTYRAEEDAGHLSPLDGFMGAWKFVQKPGQWGDRYSSTQVPLDHRHPRTWGPWHPSTPRHTYPSTPVPQHSAVPAHRYPQKHPPGPRYPSTRVPRDPGTSHPAAPTQGPPHATLSPQGFCCSPQQTQSVQFALNYKRHETRSKGDAKDLYELLANLV